MPQSRHPGTAVCMLRDRDASLHSIIAAIKSKVSKALGSTAQHASVSTGVARGVRRHSVVPTSYAYMAWDCQATFPDTWKPY